MTRRWDIKREKGGSWWQFWQHGRDRAARRTPSEFREMVFQEGVHGGVRGTGFPMPPVTYHPRSLPNHPRNVCLDAILGPGFIRLLRTAIGLSAIPRLISRSVLVPVIRLPRCFSLTQRSLHPSGRVECPGWLVLTTLDRGSLFARGKSWT